MIDWKSVADELYMVIVGMAAGSAEIAGRSPEDAMERMRNLREDIIKHNTKKKASRDPV